MVDSEDYSDCSSYGCCDWIERKVICKAESMAYS